MRIYSFEININKFNLYILSGALEIFVSNNNNNNITAADLKK
jgi:hypothetical protein